MTAKTTCFSCGGNMSLVREKTEIAHGRRSAVVEVMRSRCNDCDEIFYTPQQMDAAQMAAAEELRRQDGLLSPKQIRDIRAKFGLSQAQLEQLLGTGPKTVVRWERGTVCQNRTTDELLRLISEIPEAFERLALKNGIECVAPVEMLRETSETTVRYVGLAQTPTRKATGHVVSIAPFLDQTQRRKIRISAEEALPTIPKEALK